jgi:thymidylate synthase ThyX
VCTFPRFILAEFNTHRMLSRNAASSRAIPTKKFIEKIEQDPVMPVHWGKNQSGMQAFSEISPSDIPVAETIWLQARDKMIFCAKELQSLNIHKQIINRLLEPWFSVTVIVTATDYDNFFKLRINENAQPEIFQLASLMKSKLLESTPKKIDIGSWHIPFADKHISNVPKEEDLLKIGVARCARVSYLTFEGVIDYEKDYALHDQLKIDGHWSPFEHCATPDFSSDKSYGNFTGWKQYRKFFKEENGKCEKSNG